MISKFQARLGASDLWRNSNLAAANLTLDSRQFDVVLSTEVLLRRNIAGRLFPAVQDHEEAIEVLSLVESAAIGLENDESRLVRIAVSDVEASIALLKERQLFDPRRSEREGFAIEPPLVTFYLSEDGKRVLRVNLDDHLGLLGQAAGLDCASALGLASEWSEYFDAALGLSASLGVGFHTSRVVDSGSGLGIRFLLHIPAIAWAEFRPELEPGCRIVSMEARGLPPGTGLFWLELAPCGSEPEDVYLARAQRVAGAVAIQERRLREELRAADTLSFDDRAERGLGLMTHHLSIGLEEAFQLWGRVRTAAAMGILPSPGPGFTGLAMRMLPAHVELYSNTDDGMPVQREKGSSEDEEMTILNQARSRMIRECFSGG